MDPGSAMNTVLSRASSYVGKMPNAVAGSHGHDATFAVALALCHGFALTKTQALPIMREFSARCQPPWAEKELEHKLDSAAKVTRHSKPRGHLLGERGPSARDVSPAGTKSGATKIVDVDTTEPLPGDNPKRSVTSVPDADSGLTPEQLTEARRIVGELVKLHQRGIIKDATDPAARFYAAMIHQFGGTVVEAAGEKTEPTTSAKFTPTAAQLVRVPFGLRGKALDDFLQRDLEATFGDEDDL